MDFTMKFQLCSLWLILVPLIGAAQPPEDFATGFGVSPLKVTAEVRPGSRTTAAFTISNPGTRGIGTYTIRVTDLEQSESGAISAVTVGLGVRSCGDWIDVPTEVDIPAGSSEQIIVSISCPPGSMGGYYALLVVGIRRAETEEIMAIAVRPTISVIFEVIIPAPGISHLETKELHYNSGTADTPPQIALEVENTGVWKKEVEGDVLVYDRSGDFPVRTSIPYKRDGTPYVVYPGMTLSFDCPVPRLLEPGTHRVSVRLQLTPRVEARKEFELVVPEKASAKAIPARAGEKFEFDVDLLVEPDLFEVTIPPGGLRTLPIKVRNNDTREAHVRVQITEAVMEPSGMLTFPDAPPKESLSWLSVSEETFDIAPNRQQAIRLEAAIPRDNPPQFPVMGVVRLQVEAAATEYHDDWASGGEFAVLVVVMDPKTPPANLEIVSLDLVRPSPDKNPAAAVVRLKNTGGKVAKTRGILKLERKSGVEILHKDIGDVQSELILPGSEREFRLPLGPLDEGDFRVRAEFATLGKDAVKVKSEETFTSLSEIPPGLR